MADLFQARLRFRAERDLLRLNFIRTDLKLCLTLAGIAETKFQMGNLKHAERILVRVEKSHSDMLRSFSQAKGMTAEVQSELKSKFKQVRERLDELRRIEQS